MSCSRYFLLFCTLWSIAVTNTAAQTGLQIHLDRSAYVVGDALYYKAYASANTPVQAGQIVYVALLAPDGSTQLTQQLRLDAHSAVGNFQLPITWQEGMYCLRLYALWQSADSTRTAFVYDTPIAIYNDLTPLTVMPNASASTTNNLNPNTLTITGKNKVKKREKVTLQLQNSTPTALTNVSVSVAEAMDNADRYTGQTQQVTPTMSTANLMPLRQLSLAATVIDPETMQSVNEKYLSLYVQNGQKFKRVSAVKGFLQTNLEDFEGISNVQLLSLNPNTSRPMRMTLLPLADLPAYRATTAPPHDATIDAYLQRHLLRRKIANLFPSTLEATAANPRSSDATSADNHFNASTFTDIESVRDFVREVMLTSSFQNTPRGRSLRMMDKDKGANYTLAPWYFVDNLFTKDEAAVLQMPFRDLSAIDLYERKESIVARFDSLMFRYGVLALQSNPKLRSAAVTKLDFEKTMLSGLHLAQRRVANSSRDPQKPDFTPLRLWDSQLAPDADGTYHITFDVGDAAGKYRVHIVGQSASGELWEGHYVVNVE